MVLIHPLLSLRPRRLPGGAGSNQTPLSPLGGLSALPANPRLPSEGRRGAAGARVGQRLGPVGCWVWFRACLRGASLALRGLGRWWAPGPLPGSELASEKGRLLRSLICSEMGSRTEILQL